MTLNESYKLKRGDIIINVDNYNEFLELYEHCKVYISINEIIYIEKNNNEHPLLKCNYKSFITLESYKILERKMKINKLL